LYRENPLYRFAEHAIVGVTVGYMLVVTWYEVVIPYWYDQLILGVIAGNALSIGLIPAALIGLLWLARLVPNYAWLSRYPIAIGIGFSSGYSIPYVIQASILVHLRASWSNLIIRNDTGGLLVMQTIFGFIIFIGVLSVLCYFFFSIEHKGVYGSFTKLGVWFLMISFGASFGYTVMARLSLFIGRLQFLLIDWLHVL